MQTDNHNLNKHFVTNEKYIVRKMGFKFYKIKLSICFDIKFEPF